MLFEDNVVYNGDDCLTINNPVNNIHFRNSYCNGGHGLSIIGSMVEAGGVVDLQNVLYVADLSVGPGLLTSHSRIENVVMVSSHHHGRFPALDLPIWGRKIPCTEPGSRVGPAAAVSPRSTTITCFLSSSDTIPLPSITWKDITLKKVLLPVSSLHRLPTQPC